MMTSLASVTLWGPPSRCSRASSALAASLRAASIAATRISLSFIQSFAGARAGYFTELVTDLRAVLSAAAARGPDGTRRRRIVSQVFLPG